MFAVHILLASLVVVTENVFGLHVTITLTQIIYWVIAAVVGLLAEIVVGWHLPFGLVGAFLAALVGVWLMTDVIVFPLPHDIIFYSVPIIKALIGAIITVIVWLLVTLRMRALRRRQRYAQ